MNTMTKTKVGRKDLHFHNTVHHWRKSGQKLKQGRNLELVQKPLRAAAYLLLPLNLLSYRTQEH